jgi:DNA-binding LacI/PurR family transcriptional regulator
MSAGNGVGVTNTNARPTIADVAERAGVSRSTVSVALAGKGRVDPATRERVRAVAAELGYRPSVRAQRLRGGRSQTLALVTALPASIVGEASHLGFLLDMALPMAQACLEHGYALLLVPPTTNFGHLDSLDVDGVVVLDPVRADPICAAFADRGVRVVTVGRAAEVQADAVVDRGLAGADLMLAHLTARGARRIGVIRSEESHALSTTLSELVGRDGRFGDAAVVVAAGSTARGEQGGRDAAAALLAQHPDLDAIYAPLDAFAVGAMEAARAAGRTIPDDLLVATNYDGRRAANSSPQLTTLDLDLAGMARLAAQLLIGLLAGEQPRDVAAPEPSVIPRESTTALQG